MTESSPSPAAVRMRRTRERRRQGVVAVVPVEVMASDLDRLIARKLLKAEERGDQLALLRALHQHLDRTL